MFNLTGLLNRVGLYYFPVIRIELYVTSLPWQFKMHILCLILQAHPSNHAISVQKANYQSMAALGVTKTHHINLSLTSLQFAGTLKHHVIGKRYLMQLQLNAYQRWAASALSPGPSQQISKNDRTPLSRKSGGIEESTENKREEQDQEIDRGEQERRGGKRDRQRRAREKRRTKR